MRLRLLGPFEARLGGGPPLAFSTRRAQALLAYLALRLDRGHSRERLAALLWGEAPEASARQNLRQALTDLRRSLGGEPALRITREAVALRGALVDTDVARFERSLADGTAEGLERGLALYCGELMEGFPLNEEAFEEWLRAERDRLRTLAVAGFAKLVDQCEAAGEDEKAIRAATGLVALEPFHEPAHRTLMRLHHRHARRAAALRQYQLCVRTLRRELGAEPEEATRVLYAEIVARPPPVPQGSTAALAAAVRPLRTVELHDTPLVGRETEIAALREALSRAWRDGGCSALILGEAGIGKSRLAEELAEHASALGGRTLIGRSFELEQLLPFRPWVDAFRDGGLTADCPEVTGLSRALRAALGQLFPEWGLEGPAAGERTQDRLALYEAVAQLLSDLADAQPVLVILEDLHWADESSLRLLAFLHRRIASSRVLLVGTARDDEPEASPLLGRLLRALGADARACRLALAPLPQRALEALVRAHLRAGAAPAADDALLDRIWSMSEGNPFVAVEATRALRQRDARPGEAVLELPLRAREMIAERLERLDEDARELATVAAVVGRELDFRLLQHAAGRDAAATARALEKLVRRRVLQPAGERFAFVHERIREVACGRLLPASRRLLHEQVALAIESVHADDLASHVAALGAHFEEAGSWEKAVDYLRRAGVQAYERSASREAATCFERALRALERLPDGRVPSDLAIDLRLDLQTSLIPLCELPPIVERLREARALAEAVGDRHRLGRVLVHATHCSWWLGDCDAGLESGTAAVAIADEIGEVSLQIVADLRLGQVHVSRGECGRAQAVLGRAVERLRGREGERFGMSSLPAVAVRTFLSWALALRGELDAARAVAAEGARIAEAAGHPYSLAVAYRGLGLAPLVERDFPAAIAPFERALAICRARELPFMTVWVAGELGHAYALCGRSDEAVPLLERTLEDTARLGMMMIHPRYVVALAEAYVLAGRRADAMRAIDEGLRLARQHKQRAIEADALRVLGDAALLEPGDRARAEQSYRDGERLAMELGLRPLAAACRPALGSHAGGAASGVRLA